jgi:hypothetical protein
LKKLFKLVVVLLIANAAYRFAPPYIRYTKFKQELPDLANRAKGKSDFVITSEVTALAAKHQVPLDTSAIEIRRTTDLQHTYVDTAWVERIAFLPMWKYDMRFSVMADGYHYTPMSEQLK